MATNSTIKLTVDATRCIKDLQKYSDEVKTKLNKSIHDSGFDLQGEVQLSMAGYCAEPRSFDTGNMTRMVYTDATQDYVAMVVGRADYTRYIEDGTSKFQGRHHFRNSFLRKRPQILAETREAVKP